MESERPTIDIILATYNGGAFLGAQLRSLADQSYENWRLLIRDDGSTDETANVIEAFAALYPERVKILNDSIGTLGPVGNFSRLLQSATAGYVAFCDQDDVWMPDKLSLTMECMRSLERKHGPDCPLLVFTDLTVVDRSLRKLAPSFWKYQNLKPEYSRCLSRLLVQNVVTGSTTLMNRSLIQKTTPIPAAAAMHDWWVTLVAAAFGKIDFTPRSTVLYRQHGRNVAGAKSMKFLEWPRRSYEVMGNRQAERQKLARCFDQANAFLEIYGASLPEEEREVVIGVCSLPRLAFLIRVVRATKLRCLPRSLWQKLSLLVLAHYGNISS